MLIYNCPKEQRAITRKGERGKSEMPVISRFYGIVIKMYFRQAKHNPPHIHVIYGEYFAEIDIRTGEMLVGDLPRRALKMVEEWTEKNQDALPEIWKTQNFVELPPLE